MDTQENASPKPVEIVAVVHGVEAVVDSVDALANRRVRFAQILGIDIDALGRNAVPDSDQQVALVLDNLNVR